jgi:aldehyde dehydrogenase (NAD+)
MRQMRLPYPGALPKRARVLLGKLGVDLSSVSGDRLPARTPVTGETIVTLSAASPQEVGRAIGSRAQGGAW